eukprot:m.142041 g.142041  ORF g.142041 m.142041 type:complete len:103 (-) comp13195_c0_seq50:978-1286(-)
MFVKSVQHFRFQISRIKCTQSCCIDRKTQQALSVNDHVAMFRYETVSDTYIHFPCAACTCFAAFSPLRLKSNHQLVYSISTHIHTKQHILSASVVHLSILDK